MTAAESSGLPAGLTPERMRETIEGVFDPEQVEGKLAKVHPELEVYPPPQWPDQPVYRGADGVRQLVEEWQANFDDYRVLVDRVVEGEGCMVALVHHEGTTKAEGVFIREPIAVVWDRFDGTTPKRSRWFFGWSEALEAAGLPPDAAER